MHGSVIVGSKGQIVIPSDVRKMLEIEPGDSLFCITKDGKAIGLIPTQNLNDFMEYMKSEIEAVRAALQAEYKSKEV
jgi:AbrB family looped-hinge helix DNA binding protein